MKFSINGHSLAHSDLIFSKTSKNLKIFLFCAEFCVIALILDTLLCDLLHNPMDINEMVWFRLSFDLIPIGVFHGNVAPREQSRSGFWKGLKVMLFRMWKFQNQPLLLDYPKKIGHSWGLFQSLKPEGISKNGISIICTFFKKWHFLFNAQGCGAKIEPDIPFWKKKI